MCWSLCWGCLGIIRLGPQPQRTYHYMRKLTPTHPGKCSWEISWGPKTLKEWPTLWRWFLLFPYINCKVFCGLWALSEKILVYQMASSPLVVPPSSISMPPSLILWARLYWIVPYDVPPTAYGGNLVWNRILADDQIKWDHQSGTSSNITDAIMEKGEIWSETDKYRRKMMWQPKKKAIGKSRNPWNHQQLGGRPRMEFPLELPKESTGPTLQFWTPDFRTVRQHISVVGGTQSVLRCHRNLRKLRQGLSSFKPRSWHSSLTTPSPG